ncbi:MAG: acyltransferase [Chitinophagaceae bacterium]|nr:acyltransferase [Chitinophagaceae bacterium]
MEYSHKIIQLTPDLVKVSDDISTRISKKTLPVWFPGLNALRFLAALLVVLMHIHNNMGISGLPQLPAFPVLFKGLSAVSFFFVLSGFLITYLLLKERESTGTINIKHFYLRRVFRIWPLYFLIIAFGMLFYWGIVPAMNLPFENDYPHELAIVLYTFFLANLMNSLYHVGGILHITWSIAVEEQFYLFWAPLAKRFNTKLPVIIILITILSLCLNFANTLNFFNLSKEMQAFISTLQFHYMGFGAYFAWLLYNKKEKLLSTQFFKNKVFQSLLSLLIILYFLFYQRNILGEILTPIPLGLLFGWLIINISSNPTRIFSFENKPLNHLGKVSYGIYMYHMPFVYASAFIFQKLPQIQALPYIFFPIYYVLTIGLTILAASLSYKFIEQPLLKRSKRLF